MGRKKNKKEEITEVTLESLADLIPEKVETSRESAQEAIDSCFAVFHHMIEHHPDRAERVAVIRAFEHFTVAGPNSGLPRWPLDPPTFMSYLESVRFLNAGEGKKIGWLDYIRRTVEGYAGLDADQSLERGRIMELLPSLAHNLISAANMIAAESARRDDERVWRPLEIPTGLPLEGATQIARE